MTKPRNIHFKPSISVINACHHPLAKFYMTPFCFIALFELFSPLPNVNDEIGMCVPSDIIVSNNFVIHKARKDEGCSIMQSFYERKRLVKLKEARAILFHDIF